MRRILTGQTTWCIHERASAALLIDARDYYRAFYEAASRAKRSILILGWQFDSDVRLLRGGDVPRGTDPRSCELLTLLDSLCRQRPGLEVKMLAWDHSLLFALEREVLQKIVFDVATIDRFQFQTDGTVPLGGSHHQKLAVIDGQVAFVGSADLCHERWDTSAHVARDPQRVSRNAQPHKPYHEVQAVFTGEPARSLVELFCDRWRYATGEALDPESFAAGHEGLFERLPVTLPIPAADVALSRTIPGALGRAQVHEVRELYVRAIHGAKRMIYVETQFLTSRCVRDALVARLSDRAKPKLDVVVVLPHKPETFKEELTLGVQQASVLDDVVCAANRGGHALGIYNVATPDDDRAPLFVYIHSKLMIIDDELLTLGSANLANRSMTVDSEINATWVAAPGTTELGDALRRVRVRLLLEHLGEAADPRVVAHPEGLVGRLDGIIAEGRGRLRHHDLVHEVPSPFAKAVQQLARDYGDPTDIARARPRPSPR